jgi:VWFA-related protein
MRASGFALALLAALSAWAQPVDISNPGGGIRVRMVGGSEVRARAFPRTRALRPGDVTLTRESDRTRIVAHPADGAPVDLEVSLPYRQAFRAETTNGPISVRGLVYLAELATDRGEVELAVPWLATHLFVEARELPASIQLPAGMQLSRRAVGAKEQPRWVLQDRLSPRQVTSGAIHVVTGASPRLTLLDEPFPDDSPVKLPWQAPAILESLLTARRPSRAPPTPRDSTPSDGTPLFRSEVRIVALTVSVVDPVGAPITGLAPPDFEVLEDGARQQVRYASSEQEPFNLALLLDLSGSTQYSRPAMQEAARGFLGIARPQDQVAMYALANDQFVVISHLTKDRARLIRALDQIPGISGGSPIYDSMVLAYAEEFHSRSRERNALIVITDGLDNQISGEGTPSSVSFDKLRKGVGGMNVLIYPILLDPYTLVPPPRSATLAFKRMESIAEASGGRSFRTQAVSQLAAVYASVAKELRSVYSVGYSPANQEFDGAWRRIHVGVKRHGATVRTRNGYYAR